MRAGDLPGSAPLSRRGDPPLAIRRANAADPLHHPGPAAGVGAPRRLPSRRVRRPAPRGADPGTPPARPSHWSAVRSRSSAFQARDRSPRWPKRLARGSSRAVGSWRAGGGPRAAALGAARLARQSGTRRGAPRSAAGPSRSSGPAACHRPAASGGSPRRRQGRRPRPPSGTAPQAGAASRPERIAAASVLSVRYTVMKEALD